MPPKFGTSGLRGLVTELTPALVADHVRAFLAACDPGTGLWIGRDLRASSPALAAVVAEAAAGQGVAVTDAGAVPTPALALAAMAAGAGAVMITGSHIPDDRNGLKFYTPAGEITKAEEGAILAALGTPTGPGGGSVRAVTDTGARYLARYLAAFGETALSGLRIGVYSHSAVGRDLLLQAIARLGGQAVEVGRADRFVPVDTEAVDAATRAAVAGWVAEHGLDALISTDGDGDRPLMADERGQVVVGDVLGQIAGRFLGAEVAVTPVSSNTGAEAGFASVIRTKIGSPYVIAAMEGAGGRVVGYEANGGVLLGFDAALKAGPLPRLMTRDSLLPILAALVEGKRAGSLAARVGQEPARFTASDRLQEVPTEATAALVAAMTAGEGARARLLEAMGEPEAGLATDLTDGLRMTLASGRIVHLRPSGNAPELRLYTEAETPEKAAAMLAAGLAAVGRLVKDPRG
jgi:phosphomannomutase